MHEKRSFSQNIPPFSNCILVNYKGKYKDEKAVKICIFDWWVEP